MAGARPSIHALPDAIRIKGVKLSGAQLKEVLDRLDQADKDKPAEVAVRRAHERRRYRVTGAVVIVA